MSLNADRFRKIMELIVTGKTVFEFKLCKGLHVYGNQSRIWLDTETDILKQDKLLDTVLEKIEGAFVHNWDSIPEVIFVSEIRTKQVERQPESLIAKVWHECLGARAIPFDPAAREALIAHGCEHPELKRHIEAWQEMKRTGSKWVTGE